MGAVRLLALRHAQAQLTNGRQQKDKGAILIQITVE